MKPRNNKCVDCTGLVYHQDMARQHHCLWDKKYPESPARCDVILKRCSALKLLERCQRIECRMATKEEVHLLHSPVLTTLLETCEKKGVDELEKISSCYDAIYISPETYRLALLAVGSTINLIEAVCKDTVKNGMAVIRPPGHHAMKSAFCGYCFFNNVALAANYALQTFNLKRILIVDWDVHHGQATQQMFYSDPRVLYFSIHRFEHGTFWPNLKESNSDYIGENDGKGFNINVPLNTTGLTNTDYLSIFHQILLPVVIEYQPELILVSAGYDAAIGCFEGEMMLTPACYAHLLNSLKYFAEGRIAVVLEGGYFLSSLAEGAALTLRTLLGDSCPSIGPVGSVHESVRETILNVMYYLRPYWNCFQMNEMLNISSSELSNPGIDYFSPCLKFLYEEEVLERFPTRDCYPTRSEDTNTYYEEKVRELIRITKLVNTEHYCLAYSSSKSNNFEHIQFMFENKTILEVNEISDAVSVIVDVIMHNSTRSVLVDGLLMSTNAPQLIVNCLRNTYDVKKITYLNMSSSFMEFPNIPGLLVFSFENNFKQNRNLENTYHINANGIETDVDYLTYWLKILLPITYQFDPEIIVVHVSFNLGLSTTYACLLHWLTSLAYGRIIFIADYDSMNHIEASSLHDCVRVLRNVPIVSKKSSGVLSASTIQTLRTSTEELKKNWSNLDYFVKFNSK